MNLAEYASYDALGLADLVRRKEIAPRELCRLALQAIDTLNPQLNAVIETFPERIDAVPAPGPFAGVPFLVKDFPIEAGVRAEMGSQLAAGFAPARDSELMLRFRRAGLINLGRTTTSEFGLAALTVSRTPAPPATPGTPHSRPQGRAAARPQRSRPASCRSRTAVTAAARSAILPPSAAWSA